MAGPLKPIVLMADSQLLFWRSEGRLFLASIRARLEATRPRAAYLGASNGDRPEFFELFRSAMEGAGIDDCRAIPSRPGPADLGYLEEAELVLLAGGDPLLGWRTFESNGLRERLVGRYRAGALLLGISAGAMHLGMFGVGEGGSAEDEGPGGISPIGTPFETLGLVPFVVDAHDEPGWDRLRRLVSTVGGAVRGLGIPTGGGAFFHPDQRLEPIRHPLAQIDP